MLRSLKASRSGWMRPKKDTLLGPMRRWNNPITLRSKRVKKATDKRTSRQCKTQERISITISGGRKTISGGRKTHRIKLRWS